MAQLDKPPVLTSPTDYTIGIGPSRAQVNLTDLYVPVGVRGPVVTGGGAVPYDPETGLPPFQLPPLISTPGGGGPFGGQPMSDVVNTNFTTDPAQTVKQKSLMRFFPYVLIAAAGVAVWWAVK